MDSEEYQRVLQESPLPFIRYYRQWGMIFQQDNASVHCSRSTKAWLLEKIIVVLDWSASSLDCNSIENLWRIFVRRVYDRNRQYHTVAELKAAILHAWSEISVQTLSFQIAFLKLLATMMVLVPIDEKSPRHGKIGM